MTQGARRSGAGDPVRAGLRDATLCVTLVELNNRTGGGVILAQILAREPALAVIYSLQLFDGDCVGDLCLRVHQRTEVPAEAVAQIAAVLEGHEVTRILCAPQSTSDVLSATAAAELTGAPLVAYVMDDSNVFRGGISDAAMRLLTERSAVRFAISPLLCEVYEKKFGEPFWLLPPVNETRFFATPDLEPPANPEPRGVIIGNIWSRNALADLRSTIRRSGLRVDWYGNAGRPLIKVDPADLASDGIALHPNLADEELVRVLRRCDYAIMPSRELSKDDPHDFLHRASLPSRLVYLFTVAHLPLVVLGGADATAAQFVSRFGLGATCSYEPERFVEAVRNVTSAPLRDAIRARAAALSPSFAAEPVSDWIWRSAAVGRPVDDRYERLFADPSTAAERALGR
jgi:hypothetical protein